jgi:hypothetical protein
MDYGTRYFVFIEEKIQKISVERLEQLYHGVVPEYAGLNVPYALLLFEQVDNKLKDLRYWRGSYLTFDKNGKSDNNSGQNLVELSLMGGINPKSFVARRASQIRRERNWHPTAEQLDQMITLAKKE